ncbi:MAG: GEVED domain-containing protein [Bacteroidota bacterium]
MKKQLLSVFAALTLCFSVSAQTTVTVTATGAPGSFNTGSVNSAGTKNDGNMININSGQNAGWAKFDMTTLPTSAVIMSVTCAFTTYTTTSSTAVNNLYGFIGDPALIAGTTLYTNCNAGTAINSTSWTANATNTKVLNATGVSFVQANVTSNQLCVGFSRGSTNNYNIYGYGAAAGQEPMLVVTYSVPPACSGMPTAGTAVASNTVLCAPQNVNLSLTGSTSATGLSYQWLSSPDGVSWSPIPTATNIATTQSVTSTTYYQCAVACGTDVATSSTVTVNFGVMPNGGTSVATSTLACAGQTVGLSLTGASSIPGLTYQWQSSPNGSSWTSIPSATTSVLTQTYSSAVYYQAVLACATTTAASSSVQVNANPFYNCYCVTTPGTSNTVDNIVNTKITNSLGGVLNQASSSVAPNFVSYNNTPLDLVQGSASNSVAITMGSDGSQYGAAWIDLNANGTYEVSENIGLTGTAVGGGAIVTYTFAVPAGAPLGLTRIRVRGGSDAIYTTNACATSAYGETEDYLVNIILAPSCLPPASLAMSANTATMAATTWTAGGSETAWDVYYGTTPLTAPTATTVPTATTAATGYTLNGLTPNTSYIVYVRSNCGAGNLSTWLPITFMTPCLSPNITGTTPSTRCGIGTTTLSATGDAGATLNWYTNAVGGAAVATGTLYTTPSLTTTTDFYVTAGSPYPGSKAIGLGASSGTGLSYNLTQGGYGGLKGQYLYTAAELAGAGITAGNITSLTFELTGTPGSTLGGFAVEVGTTTLTAFNATGQNIQGGLTTVYPAALFTPVTGMNIINFSTPFNWNGTSNIIVSISWSNNNTSNTSSTIKYDVTSFYASQTYRKDSETAANMFTFTGSTGAGTFSYGSSQDRPQFTFGANLICESPRVAVTASVTSPPALTLSSPAAICGGSGIATFSVTSAAANYDSYIWSPNTGLYTDAAATVPYTGGNMSMVYVNSTAAGVLNYNVNASNSTSGCASATSASVSILEAPTSLTVSGMPNPVCAGSTVSLTAMANAVPVVLLNENFNGSTNNWTTLNASTGGTPAVSSWSLVPGNSTIWSSFVAANVDGSQMYVTNSDAQGNGSKTKTILQSPAINTMNMTTLSLNFEQFYQYWASGDSAVMVQASTNGTTWTTLVDYKVAAASVGALTSFSNTTIGLNAYVNNPTLYVRFNYNATWGYGWAIDNVKIDATTTSDYTYSWTSAPAGFTSTVSNPTDMPAGTTDYSVVITNTTTSCSNSSVLSVTVNPVPTVTASASSSSVCAGSSATLTAGGATTYSWSSGGTAFTESVTPSAASVYTITGTTNGCSNTATVSVGLTPLPSVTAVASQTLLCDNGSTGPSILTASTSATSYSWSEGSTTMTISVSPTVTTNYTVTVDDGNCSADATVLVSVMNCNSIQELVAEGINIYPNPTNGILNISISTELAGATSIEVYDALGKLVIKETLTSEITTINTTKLTDGMYMFKVISNNKAIKIGKIVKH